MELGNWTGTGTGTDAQKERQKPTEKKEMGRATND